ncbi:hypothetical protein RB2083_2899 [Rhodobacteraceae bacterium HTCC2083]|nr:hypothetical protein RB2083_2899 [Rhodobacteraceae bacterium HTCC2083]
MVKPKKRGPDQLVPVMCSAMAESDLYASPFNTYPVSVTST